jgi:hypothetical protein
MSVLMIQKIMIKLAATFCRNTKLLPHQIAKRNMLETEFFFENFFLRQEIICLKFFTYLFKFRFEIRLSFIL